MEIKHKRIAAKNLVFEVDKKEYRCTPKRALKPCFPQDEFEGLESCSICNKNF